MDNAQELEIIWPETGEYLSIEMWEKCKDRNCFNKATHELWQQNEYLDFRGKYCLEHILEFKKLNKKENDDG